MWTERSLQHFSTSAVLQRSDPGDTYDLVLFTDYNFELEKGIIH
jgi:hypothetical protein